MMYAPFCRAEGLTGEFFLLPQAGLVYRSGLDNDSALDKDDQVAAIDFFATFEINNFRFLTEYLLSNHEHEFERFQLGWLLKEQLFWVGRFHNPISYWNTLYHHGEYLQTSISRPAIFQYEENSGILPMHQAGLLVEGAFGLGENDWGYAFAFAAGPEFTDELEPWDVVDPGSGNRDISTTVNLYRDAVSKTTSRVGGFANYTRIPASTIGIDAIRQTSLGIYGGWEYARWRWHGSAIYIRNQFEQTAASDADAFFNAYVQVEYEKDDYWTFYGRIEETFADQDDAYLALFPNFTGDSILGGVRLDFAGNHALKLELSTNQAHQDDFTQTMLQWSSQF